MCSDSSISFSVILHLQHKSVSWFVETSVTWFVETSVTDTFQELYLSHMETTIHRNVWAYQ